MILLVLTTLLFFGVLDPAWGWHPGTHVFLGNRLLEMGLLSTALSSLVKRHRLSYLFGCVATDILFPDVGVDRAEQKPRTHPILDHPPHNWKIARDLEQRANTDPLRAFALGYRLHLAADTVAHEQMLPRIRSSRNGVNPQIAHLLGESIVERGVPREDVQYLNRIVHGEFSAELELLKDALDPPEGLWMSKQFTFRFVLRGFTWTWSRSLLGILSRLAKRTGPPVEFEQEIQHSLQSMQKVGNLNSKQAQPILAQNP